MWACEKAHVYIYASEFDVVTDNKAVELIFSNPYSKPKARIERWCLRLLPYNFNVIHKPGNEKIADFLSRNPIQGADAGEHEEIAERYTRFISSSQLPKAISREQLIEATSNTTHARVKRHQRRHSSQRQPHSSSIHTSTTSHRHRTCRTSRHRKDETAVEKLCLVSMHRREGRESNQAMPQLPSKRRQSTLRANLVTTNAT